MRLSHLNALRALEATLRHGSFTAAAAELGITPAAVGQRVRSLEEYLGKQLFERTNPGIKALADARQVETVLTSGFSAIAGGLEQLKASKSRNQLSVTLPASFAENWLTPSISEFYRRHEEVDLRLDASNRDVDLLAEGFDFAIRYGKPPPDYLEGTVLFGDWVLPVCSPEFAERYAITPELRTLEDIPIVHVLNRTSDPGWAGYEAWGKAFGFDPDHLNHGVRYSRVGSGLQSAIAGQGLVLCGLVEAYNAISSGRLILPFGPSLRCRTGFVYRLLWVRGKPMSPLQDLFRDWILEKSAAYDRAASRLLAAGRDD